jgi:hypothetical protein
MTCEATAIVATAARAQTGSILGRYVDILIWLSLVLLKAAMSAAVKEIQYPRPRKQG